MITVSEGRLKTKMAEYFRKVEQTGEELIVTSNNIPIVKIIPIPKKKHVNDVFGDIRGTVKYHDDILKPDTDEWGDI